MSTNTGAENGTHGTPLKRLSFVHSVTGVASTATAQVGQAYTTVKSYSSSVPVLEKSLSKAEEIAETYASPVVGKVADSGEKLLRLADDTVDKTLNTVTDSLNSVKELHQTNMKTFSEATTTYFDTLSKAGDWAAARLNPVTGVQAARDALAASIAKAKEMTDPDVAVGTVYDAWVKFTSIPAVNRVLQTAEPVTKQALAAADKLHAAIVHNSLYKKGLDTGYSTLSWATTTTPYKLAGKYLYPWVQPIADPALDKFSHSKVINDLATYWKPTITAA